MLEEVRQQYNQSNWKISKLLAEEYIDQYHENEEEARALLHSSTLELGEKDANVSAEIYLKHYPLSAHANLVRISLADFWLRKGSLDKAYSWFDVVEPLAVSKKRYDRVLYGKALCEFERGQFQKSLENFELISSNSDFLDQSMFYQGFIYHKLNQYKRALELLLKVPGENAILLIVDCYKELGEIDKLLSFGEENISRLKGSTKAALYRFLGDAYFEKKDHQSAIKNYELLIGKTPKQEATVYYQLAVSYEELGNDKKSIEAYKIAALDESEIGQSSSYRLGLLYLSETNYEFAATAFQKASSLALSDEIKALAKFLAGKSKIQLEQYDEGIRILEEFLNEYPNHEDAQEASDLLAQGWLLTSNYDLAISHIESLERQTPITKEAYQKVTFSKGLSLYDEEAFNAAIRNFNKSLRYPEEPQIEVAARYWTGEAYAALKDFDEAMGYWQTSADADDDEIKYRSLYALGSVSIDLGQYQEAADYFKKMAAITSDHPLAFDSRLRLADAYYMIGSFENAIEGYTELLSGEVENQEYLLYQLGLSHYQLKEFEVGLDYLKKVVETQGPIADEALNQMGMISMERSDFQESTIYFQAILDDYPNSPYTQNALLRKGLALSNIGKFPEATFSLGEVLIRFTNKPEAKEALLGLQSIERQGYEIPQLDRWIEDFKAANPEDDSIEAIDFERIKTFYFNGDYVGMRPYARRFIRTRSSSNFEVDVRYYLADSYYQQNQFDEALKEFEPLLGFPDYDYYQRVLDKRGKSLLALKSFDEALENYRLFNRRAQNPKEQYLALEGLMLAHKSLSSDSCLYYADVILRNEWQPYNGSKITQLHKIEFLVDKGRWQQVDTLATELLKDQDQFAAKAIYLKAYAKSKLNEYTESNELIFTLIGDYASFSEWTNKGYLLLVDNYLGLGEVLQAEATNNSILENASDKNLLSEASSKKAVIEEAKNTLILESTDSLTTEKDSIK